LSVHARFVPFSARNQPIDWFEITIDYSVQS
jgi:hypothetical protein